MTRSAINAPSTARKAQRAKPTAPRQAKPNPTAAQDLSGPAQDLSELESAVEALVRQHTSCAVIDAAWAAAHRLFQPVRIA